MHAALILASAALLQGQLPGMATRQTSAAQLTSSIMSNLLATWQNDWFASERARRPALYAITDDAQPNASVSRDPREADLHCRFDYDRAPMFIPDHAWGEDPGKRKIGSKTNERHWVCPNWLPPADYYLSGPKVTDERLGIDAALQPEYRTRIGNLRRAAIAGLQQIVDRYPRDSVPVGQLVRLLVDQRLFTPALLAANACLADASWCQSLVGYVQHVRSDYAAANIAFDSAAALMSPDQRCAWNDIGALLDGSARGTYARMTCAGRDSIAERVWWLADPLWSMPGNDRRSEQFARRVLVTLHAALGRDERYDWSAQSGGDALATMVLRYGWPSYTYTGNFGVPAWQKPPPPLSGGLYMPGPPIALLRASMIRPPPAYQSTYEYTIGRIHLVPPWSMIEYPFNIRSAEWSVNGPSGAWDATLGWWPQEHYAPAFPLVEIMDQQTAQLRRQDTVLFAYATNLARTELKRSRGDSVDAQLVVSTGPGAFSVVEAMRTPAFGPLVFLAPIPVRLSVASVEILPDTGGRYAGRARFGLAPVMPLSAMAKGTYSISEPVLLSASSAAPALPNTADGAIPFMLGSTSLTSGTSTIGVYWETYGFTSTDSVSVAVTIQPHSLMSVLRVLGSAMGVMSVTNAPVSLAWKEPQAGHDARTVNGGVPIQMRSVSIDITSLTPGVYTLEVSVAKPGQTPVHSTRDFALAGTQRAP